MDTTLALQAELVPKSMLGISTGSNNLMKVLIHFTSADTKTDISPFTANPKRIFDDID